MPGIVPVSFAALHPSKKKGLALKANPLYLVVGRTGVEPVTNGLKVRNSPYLPLSTCVDRIYAYQHVSPFALCMYPCRVLIEMHINMAYVATWWLHGGHMKDNRNGTTTQNRIAGHHASA